MYHSNEEFESGGRGYVTLQEAASILGMKQRAFDLLVAAHRDLFAPIMKYEGRWFIPDLYLDELSRNRDFSLVQGKYELLAKRLARAARPAPAGHSEKGSHRQNPPRTDSGKESSHSRSHVQMASAIANLYGNIFMLQ